jgi:hypothetical protein
VDEHSTEMEQSQKPPEEQIIERLGEMDISAYDNTQHTLPPKVQTNQEETTTKNTQISNEKHIEPQTNVSQVTENQIYSPSSEQQYNILHETSDTLIEQHTLLETLDSNNETHKTDQLRSPNATIDTKILSPTQPSNLISSSSERSPASPNTKPLLNNQQLLSQDSVSRPPQHPQTSFKSNEYITESSLLRLFQSEYFTTWLAVNYIAR